MNPEQPTQPQPTPQQPPQPPQPPVPPAAASYGTTQQSIMQPMQQATPTMPAQRSKKPLLLLIGVAIALLLIGGVTFTVLGGDKKQETPSAEKKETPKTTETPTTPAETTPTTPSEPTTPSADQAAQDTQRRASINTMHSRLEEYYNNNNAYPASFTTATFETPLSIAFFTAPNGKPIVMKTPAKDQAAAVAVPLPSKDEQYQYIPYACSGNECTKYIIRAYQAVADSQGSNVFTKNSLN